MPDITMCEQVGWVKDLADTVIKHEARIAELEEALQQVLIEYDDVDLASAEPASFTAAFVEARAALKEDE